MLDSEPMLETQIKTKAVLPPSLPPARSRKLRFAVLLVLAILIVAGVVFWGINARIQTAAAVKETTRELAIPAVSVIHPKPGAMKNEVVLPGNVHGFHRLTHLCALQWLPEAMESSTSAAMRKPGRSSRSSKRPSSISRSARPRPPCSRRRPR